MKSLKTLLSGLMVLALVTGALAFKEGSIFSGSAISCQSNCVGLSPFKQDPLGLNNGPCGFDPVTLAPKPVYYLEVHGQCIQFPAGTTFSTTTLEK